MSLKQGLSYLIEQARQRGYRPQYDEKAIIIPIFSFINQLIASIKGFLSTKEYDCWYAYFIDQHLHERTLSNMISKFNCKVESWQKLKETSLECYLLQSLLTVRNRNKLRLYLKTRKYVLQTASQNAMLDEILLDLQDSIAIVHKIFTNQEIRKALVQGIRNIFLAFKISQAKLYSSVLIEYLLAVYDSIIRIETQQATISGQFSTNRSNYEELFSSISNFQSTIHNENGLYKKNNFIHSHATQKKYQIIEKKFIPIKDASQYVSNPNNSHKFASSASKHKNQQDKDKSVFYEFISNKNQSEANNSMQKSQGSKKPQNLIQESRNRKETSYEKQEKYYRKLYMQPSHDNFHSPSPQQQKQKSNQRKSFSPEIFLGPRKFINEQPVSKFAKKQPEANHTKAEPAKGFSLGWFSNKLFETENDEQGAGQQSYLRKSRNKILKKAEEKRRQSTDRFEIEKHLLNTSSIRMHDSKNQRDHAAESDKSEQFEKMVSKNQVFKEKMLKKSQVQVGSGLESDRNLQEVRERRSRIFQGENENKQPMNFNNLKFDSETEGLVQFTSNFGSGEKAESFGKKKKQEYTLERDISSESLRMMKKRNEMILNDLNQEEDYDSGEKYRQNEINDEEDNKVYNFKKVNPKIVNTPQFSQKPQIIHKSIGQKKLAYFSKYSNGNNQIDFSPKANQNSYEEEPVGERSSYQIGKMKSLLRIIDDYRQNAVEVDFGNKHLEISQSFYKKSRFNSEMDMDSIQEYSYEAA